MRQPEPLIRNISDTARWVAVYRAQESERPDALFHDRFARELAGERGHEIASAVERRGYQPWPLAIRTFLFDQLILDCVRQGVDVVVNLAAGLDMRPFRMDLPRELVWVEVDLPEILDYKESVIRDQRSQCALRRVRMDLGDRGARRHLLSELGRQSKNALVITEGLLIYLTPEQAAELASDLAQAPGLKHWIVDIVSPGLRRMMTRRFGSFLEEANAPFQFSPEEGPGFFGTHGWKPVATRSIFKTAAAKRRVNWMMRLFALWPDPKFPLNQHAIWGGVCLLERG